ncbi:endonuclease domain-containing protein [Amnibacterium kyonggiense]
MLPIDWGATAALALRVLQANDGVAHISSFLASGLTRHQVAALFRLGAVARPRIGWYADPLLPHDAVRAVRVGGVLGAVSAARSYGLPLPEDAPDELFVSLTDNASRLRHSRDRTTHVGAGDEADVRWVWADRMEAVRGHRVAVVDALLQLVPFVPFEWLVAAMDKALHVPRGGSPLISPPSWALLRPALPERLRRAWDLADGRSESPIETILRLGLVRLGIAFELQVWMLPYRRVDFLIGGWLIIEVDGRRYHASDERFEADRERDAMFAAWGYRVLRFSYRQVTEDLEWVLEVVQSVLVHGSGRIG